jgi:zinc-ribbon domain
MVEDHPNSPLAFADVDSEEVTGKSGSSEAEFHMPWAGGDAQHAQPQPTGGDAGEDPGTADPGDADRLPVPEEAPARPLTIGQLRRERKRLWDERQEAVYHLGGLSLDLFGRERLADALVSRRAEVVAEMDRHLVELDDQLREVDDRRRRGRVREPEPVGYCMSCGAPHVSDAAFCFRCGARIQNAEAESDTQVLAMPETDAR